MSGRKAWKEEGTSDGGKLILRTSPTHLQCELILNLDDYEEEGCMEEQK
jgi:hypothetical protein